MISHLWIVLNYFWIPSYGIIGAAWATLVSYFFTYVGSGLFFSPARKIAVMQLKSIFLLDLFNQLRFIGTEAKINLDPERAVKNKVF